MLSKHKQLEKDTRNPNEKENEIMELLEMLNEYQALLEKKIFWPNKQKRKIRTLKS